jgi:hypothetical protein
MARSWKVGATSPRIVGGIEASSAFNDARRLVKLARVWGIVVVDAGGVGGGIAESRRMVESRREPRLLRFD